MLNRWNPDFSKADINFSNTANLTHYVISRQSYYSYSPPGALGTINMGSNGVFNPYKSQLLWWQN